VGMLAFLVALLAMLLVGCGSDEGSAAGGADTSSSVVEAGFSGVTLDGTEVSLGDYRGKPLVLVFMATW
jgi:cytochrome oxidase Cu insertion factor (SCO1/SenC/PrrC family)